MDSVKFADDFQMNAEELLWSLIEPNRIPTLVQTIPQSEEHIKYASSVICWEISLKYALGKLQLQGRTPDGVLVASAKSGFKLFTLNAREAASAHQLPSIPHHKESGVRLL